MPIEKKLVIHMIGQFSFIVESHLCKQKNIGHCLPSRLFSLMEAKTLPLDSVPTLFQNSDDTPR